MNVLFKIKVKTYLFLKKLFRKEFIVIDQKRIHEYDGKTATKSKFGFWYVGNIFDMSDLAHGVLKIGEIEPEITNVVERILTRLMQEKKDIVFFDIGSNTGYYALLAAYMGKGLVRSYGFDPVSEFCQIAEESTRLNRLEQLCFFYTYALGNTNGEVTIHMASTGTTLYPELRGNFDLPQRKVPQITLDNLQTKEHIPDADFIIMDIEGHEFQALQGSQVMLARSMPVIFYESVQSEKVAGFENEHYYAMQKLLQGLGYNLFLVQDEKLTPVSDSFKIEGVQMYLAIHPSKHAQLTQLFSK